MRIITQDKANDIPYERVCISIMGNKLIAYDTNDLGDNGYWTLGVYENEERALEIMKEIGGTYTLNKICEIQTTMTSEVRELTYTPFFEMPEE